MSTVLEPPPAEPPTVTPVAPVVAQKPWGGLRTDTLAESVVVLLVLAAAQRVVGFLRGILVCRWLDADELGQWDMAFSFLALAAPLAVLGLPGSFGRYVEHFRQRGRLGLLVQRTALACTALTALAVAILVVAAPQVSQLVFGRGDRTQLAMSLAICLIAVIAFNYLTELLTALRMARTMSVVQFFNSLLFAAFSVSLLLVWQKQAAALVAAYGGACLLLVAGMLWYLRRRWSESSSDVTEPIASTDRFWSRLLPFAAWVWVANLLFNLFGVIDRYMIVHTSTAADPLTLVGDYHSSRLAPLLLVSIAALLATITLPHLSCDWEAGRRGEVSRRLNLALKLLGLLLFAGSIVILLAGPLLFDTVFAGKFTGGWEVLPWTLAYCCWLGMTTLAQTYLWCAERARLGCLALLVGLVVNVVLNLILLPRLGLLGAVLATAAANAVALAMMYAFNARLGMRVEHSVLLVSLLPIAVGFGLWIALPALAAVIVGIVGTDRIFTRDEKRMLLDLWRGYVKRFTPHNISV